MESNKTTALVLRKIHYGESDAVVTFLNDDGKRFSGFAKGEAVSQKRFGGSLDLFNTVGLVYQKGKEEMIRLSSAEIVSSMPALRTELSKFAAACYFSELVLSFLHDNETVVSLYDVFTSFLKTLNDDPAFKPHLIPLMEHQMLHLFGYKPELASCIQCQTPLTSEKKYFFQGAKGGVVCSGCAPAQTNYPITYLGLQQMLAGFEMPPNEWGSLDWTSDDVHNARSAFEYFIQYTAGKPLKSLTFLSQILA